jgi:hypothetical protein
MFRNRTDLESLNLDVYRHGSPHLSPKPVAAVASPKVSPTSCAATSLTKNRLWNLKFSSNVLKYLKIFREIFFYNFFGYQRSAANLEYA